MKNEKIRIDALLVERGLAENLEHARALLMSGSVSVDGKRIDKAGQQVSADADLEVRGSREFVSRGGRKLAKALEYFEVSVSGIVCIDCGASTGGFTDCLLKNGARLVYSVDVGYGQLDWRLRNDPKVVPMERTNIRYMTADMLEFKPELAVIDVSFISLALVLPVVRGLLTEDGQALCLIKPQFEADRDSVGAKGVVSDPQTHMSVLSSFLRYCAKSGFYCKGITFSPIKGPEGNIEYLGRLCCQGENDTVDVEAVVRDSHAYFL